MEPQETQPSTQGVLITVVTLEVFANFPGTRDDESFLKRREEEEEERRSSRGNYLPLRVLIFD